MTGTLWPKCLAGGKADALGQQKRLGKGQRILNPINPEKRIKRAFCFRQVDAVHVA